MDECTLNDLLECSVCLDRLDTSSKVLPCQHTFCRNCLNDIVQKNKVLRCPECRILVAINVDDLPPNVLLMRILEGMKNATPKTQFKLQEKQPTNKQRNKHNIGELSPIEPPESENIVLQLPQQLYAKAIYDFEAKQLGDLQFKRGDIIFLRKRIDAHWYQGECNGKQGLLPVTYVQSITPLPSVAPQCKALYNFQNDKHEEEGCLNFKEGNIINVIRRVDENWAEGKLDGRVGIFPISFVEMNNLARSLMNLSINLQPDSSRVVPPTPTSDSKISVTDSLHVNQILTNSVSKTLSTNTSTSTRETSPATSSKSAAIIQTTNGGQFANQIEEKKNRNEQQRNKEKRHSLNSSSSPINLLKNKTNRHSIELLSDGTKRTKQVTDKPLPVAYVAIYPYKPQKSDELELRKGSIYTVTERCQDGWFKGTSNRTQKSGVFPGNYVAYAGRTAPVVASNNDESVSLFKNSTSISLDNNSTNNLPPELPPRLQTNTIDLFDDTATNATTSNNKSNSVEKVKERKEKNSVGLMRRLTNIKRSKSPPFANLFHMDNPGFDDSHSSASNHSVHIRSGSCPSQFAEQIPPKNDHRMFGSTSGHRFKHKERPALVIEQNLKEKTSAVQLSPSSLNSHHHRKSNSLDAGNRNKTNVQTVNELFRCETPYPALSEYELELQKGDLIYVHKKRDDGWYKGTLKRNGRTGLFPASFVKPDI